ncbi:hypothetical protein H4R20_001308 [Coemansia guatemalensis]|uniref:Amino acid permease/ SLC12A domain-containing protein n=1 Tax=Coemansia guatemalensis TaxID=2761395 RepID=A0A9W8HXM9_9FUNG|nr:hypothetical protein H4R20_001308 [Coemansia guatemalensis]
MSRFLSRAGTNIDDLERQLARVGSTENDTSADEAIAGSSSTSNNYSSGGGGAADERTTLIGSKADTELSPSYAGHGNGHHGGQSDDSVQYQHAHILQGEESSGKRARRSRRAAGNVSGTGAAQSAGDGEAAAAPRKLGTWDGVFMPVTLSIWGILVYVRMGYFLSQVGIAGTVVSFACGFLVTTMTTLSISAISTNGTVKGGGPYYMLSRSLGPEFGGSIGLMFYAGTLLNAVLNTVAFVEPLLNNFGQVAGDVWHIFPEGTNWHILYSAILFTLCTVVCLTGAQMFAKASTVLSTFVIASTAMILFSFVARQPFVDEEKSIYYTSWSLQTFRENLWPDLAPIAEGRPAETFSTVLGVLFPACIGIMAGASMSSSLRKPSKSIPKGTLWAILLTFVLYMAIVLSLGATTRRQTLRDNFNVLQEINVLPIIVPLGAIITSITSTLSGVISAASVLQAIAKDDLFSFLGPLRHAGDDPRRAIIITFVLAQMSFFVGDTNAVAPFTTMFNLIMFGFVNFACLVLKLAASVNFRPTFHYFKAWTAALGAVGCFTIMFFVDITSALVSTGVVVVLFLYVHYTCPPKPWGDVTQSLIYHQCRKYMLRLDLRKDHVKFWRPQILLLVHNPRSSLQLIRFCNALKKGGLYVVGHVIKGEFHEMLPEYRLQEAAWLKLVDELKVKAFVNLTVDRSDDAGARSIIFGAGLGGMRPNIVVLGFLNLQQQQQQQEQRMQLLPSGSTVLPTDGIKLNTPISPVAYVRIIEDVMAMGKAIGIAHGFSNLQMSAGGDIAVPNHSQQPLLPLSAGKRPKDGRQYIDLWPIQIGTSAPVVMSAVTSNQSHTYLTNFDSYVMVLQLGTVLHLVPYWNHHFRLRVMCFVEHERDVAEEHRRVAKLLRDLRVDAELHVHYLRRAGLATYDNASTPAAASTTEQQQRPSPLPTPQSLPPNAKSPIDMPRKVPLSAGAVPDSTEPSTPTGFSMKVNLPMPLRYEATRKGQVNSQSQSSSSGDDDASSSSGSESDSDSEVAPDRGFSTEQQQGRRRASLLERSSSRFTSNSGDETTVLSRVRTLGTHAHRAAADRLRLNTSATGTRSRSLARPRRRSDGSMVLTDFYGTFAALSSVLSSGPSRKNKGKRSIEGSIMEDAPEAAKLQDTTEPVYAEASAPAEFNDMSFKTQNRILNELIRRHSSENTALIFTALQAPEPGTSDSESRAIEYLEDIEALAHNLPPMFLVHATSLTVTTSL